MTVGPDLTDDNGRLRPEVARAIQNVPDGPLPLAPEVAWPEAVVEPTPVAPAAAQPVAAAPVPAGVEVPVARRLVGQRFAPPVPHQPPLPPTEIRIPVPRLFVAPVPFGTVLVGAVLVALLAVYGWTHLIKQPAEHFSAAESIGEQPKQQVAANDAPGESTPGGAISGINVNLRAGPGLGYAVLTKLMDGQPVVVREARDGWVSITTNSGLSGWVFGAYVSGVASSSHVPAVVRRLMVGGVGDSRVVLRPGDRVLHERGEDGRHIALLADGRRIVVGEGGLADVR